MPIIPLLSPMEFTSTVMAFHHQLTTNEAPAKRVDAVRSLLPHCSYMHSLPEHTVNILSDITADFKDLIRKATTTNGKHHLRDHLGDDAENLIHFWQDEYMVE